MRAWLAGLLLHPMAAEATSTCTALAGAELLPRTGIVIVGEYHGTREPAKLFQDMVCARLQSAPEDSLLVALELPARFNVLWRNDERLPLAEQLRELRADPFWRTMMDGRRSASSLALVSWLLEQRAADPNRLHLLAFETPNIDEQGAVLIDEQLRQQPVDQSMLFTGNGHARKTPVRGKQSATLAGTLLAQGHSVLSLDIRVGSGEAWFCSPECSLVRLPDRSDGSVRRIELNPDSQDELFDGWYYIPTLSVSEPAGSQGSP